MTFPPLQLSPALVCAPQKIRFYFVSNAALLDILSNGNDPPKIQPHLGSVFDGIGCLEFSVPDESVDTSAAPDGAGDDPSIAESRKR